MSAHFTSNVAADKAAAIGARIDRIPALTRKHYSLLAMLTGLFVFDIIDLSSFAYVAPAIRKEWNLSIDAIGVLTSTAFIGMFIGGLVGGRLADRFGRRPVVLIAVTFFSLASLASAFATGPVFLGVTRFLMGLGLQAATGAVLVMASEMFPKPFRGRAMSAVLGFSLIGSPLIALLARIVVPIGAWHWIYIVGAGGILIAVIGLRALPESPRWLAAHGRFGQAEAGVQVYEDQYMRATGRELPSLVFDTTIPTTNRNSVTEIFSRRLIGRTAAATVAFCLLILLNYGFAQWLPTILIERGYPQEDALTFAFILSFAYIIGAFVAIGIIDRVERKVTISVSCAVMAIAYLAIGFVPSVPVLLVAGAVSGLLSQTVSAVMYSYVPEIFPTEVRGVAAGFANGTGRVAGIFSGVIVAAIIGAFATQGVFVYLAVVAVAMAGAILFGPSVAVRQAHQQLQREKTEAAPGSSGQDAAPLTTTN